MAITTENALRREFAEFARHQIAPRAAAMETSGVLCEDLVTELGRHGYLAGALPREAGGLGLDSLTFGFLVEELGRYSSSVRNLVTVHSMVSQMIWRWGTDDHKKRWLPGLSAGRIIGAFALTEPDSGSDFDRITTTVSLENNKYVVSGSKMWISCGSFADLYLVFGKLENEHVALLIPRAHPGVSVRPIEDRLCGARASHLAEVFFENVALDACHFLGRRGFGKSAIGAMALDLGRYTIAWGSLGLAKECLQASVRHAREVVRFGQPIGKHQMVAKRLAEMFVAVKTAEAQCRKAAELRDSNDPDSLIETYVAKYLSTKALSLVGKNGVHILGARGCMEDSIVSRAYRDAPLMELIEGTTDLCESIIAESIMSTMGSGGL